MQKKLLIASNNQHKIAEFRKIFDTYYLNLNLISPNDLKIENFEIEENGSTFQENALIKAKAFYEKTGITCLSDDSGIVCQALNGNPGIFSARYANIGASDFENRQKLLENMNNSSNRSAYFFAVICLYNSNGHYFFEGKCDGHITFQEQGTNGFGYDPIFIPDGFELSFAELDAETKNEISHRARAMQSTSLFLKNNQNYLL